ncbi:MAG TPA: TIGR04282 family arsenosugar biosynthesis glycosyltransferase [Terriglobia bacterium]|nr:TIGR04282 family arsenosugar biosynthesis glycosyltransferase [Terriglobia bacterium]
MSRPLHPETGPARGGAIAVFARAPLAGQAKTRLIPLLGAGGAAAFQAALLADTLRTVAARPDATRYLFLTGGRSDVAASARFVTLPQHGVDLGERLEHVFRLLLRRHRHAVVIATDSPALRPAALRLALRELRVCDAVLGPCPDGGYYLIGLRTFAAGMFDGVRWGSAFAFRDTLYNLTACGLSCSVLEPLEDIDRPADFQRLAAKLRHADAARERQLAPAVWRFIKSHGSHVA